MNKDNMTVRWGATLPLTLTNDEEGATTATLTISKDDVEVLTKTASFVDLEADLTLTAEETELTPDVYDYMITVVYDDGTIEKYPDTQGCTDCELPTLEVCDTNDNVGVS
jgi:hypothetical protein